MPAAAEPAPLKHSALLKSAASRPVVIDIAWDRPTVAQIKATGAVGVIRYYSTDPTKNLTAAEVAQYHAAGLLSGEVWETTAGRALAGYRAGVADAQAAGAQRAADGLPTGVPTYFAVDTDTDWASVEPYFAGAASVLSQALIGPYGGIKVIDGAYAAGYRFLWQTLAWSNGLVSPHAVLYQDGRTVLGGTADINQVMAPDWGQFPRPEVDMPLTDADVDTILNHKMPAFAAVPDASGKPYIPTVAEVLNGAKTADSQIAAIKTELDTVKSTAASVLTEVQQILSAGNATEAEVQAAITAELNKLGALLGGVK
jgi:hypothetical protein